MIRASSLGLILLLLAACGGREETPDRAVAPAFGYERSFSGGPVTLTVRLTAETVGLAESLVLEEEVIAETGFAAELPEFATEDFDGLGIADVDEDAVERDGGFTVRRRRLTLEPERSGELVIPVREAWFHRDGADEESSVASEAIPITVEPIEDADAVALPEARPVFRPEDVLVEDGLSAWWWVLLALPAAVAGLVLLRRRRRPEPPPRPAHELAWEALRRLAAAKLLEAGEVERFFVALSAILREYVERRFGVRAPERTTREFLGEAVDHPNLAEHCAGLERFLELADRVKFARHRPEDSRIQEAVDVTRTFVETTQEVARA